MQDKGALDSTVVEGWIVGAFTGDSAAGVPGVVSALCGTLSPADCLHVVDAIVDGVFYRGDVSPAVDILCGASGLAEATCRFRRSAAEWRGRHPQIAHSLPDGAMATLRDVLPLLCRVRVARRCALYALYAVVGVLDDAAAAAAAAPCIPYDALDLATLEGWARGRCGVRALALPLVLEDERDVLQRPAAGHPLSVVADALAVPAMSHARLAALTMAGDVDATYAGTALPCAADIRSAVNAALTRAFATQLLITESTNGPPLSGLVVGVDIFSAYPGTRAAVVRHGRNPLLSARADFAVLVALPDP